MKNNYYVTTPIYYVNDKPHIGAAYTTIAADVLARYHRLKGDEVYFLTGTDENSQKNVEAAQKLGMEDIQAYLDMQAAVWQQTWDSLSISNNDFIRTTEDRHKKGVEKFFKTVYDKGDIYKGTYKGYYCTGCEEFKLEGDLVEGNKCPVHLKEVSLIEEENYFFKCSSYRDQILAHIEANPDFVQPASRRNEIINYLQNHFTDVSISRQSVKWGIPLPIDPSHVVYVWFDALVNYLTGIGYGTDDEMFNKFWPANLHLVGKDIIKFHCALWPAMLLSAGIQLPKHVFAHGFFTVDGHKISKSLGNTVDPVELAQKYSLDAVRYFLLREFAFGQDGDFSYSRLDERYSSDLAKGLGNFVSRVITLAEKGEAANYKLSGVEKEQEIKETIEETWRHVDEVIDYCKFDEILESIWTLLKWGDKHIEETKPWALLKEDVEQFNRTMALLLELVRQVSILIYPFMPDTAEKIWKQLGVGDTIHARELEETKKWGSMTPASINKGESLFPARS